MSTSFFPIEEAGDVPGTPLAKAFEHIDNAIQLGLDGIWQPTGLVSVVGADPAAANSFLDSGPLAQPSASAAMTITSQYQAYLAPFSATTWQRPATRSRRRPAPLGLRVAVIALGAIFFVVSIGIGVVVGDPAVLPHNYGGAVAAPPSPATTKASLLLTEHSTARSDYLVGATSYAILVKVTRPCWIVVSSPANHPVFEQTLLPTSSPARISVHGSATLMLAAQANSVTIQSGATTLGVIAAPHVGMTYDFTARTT